MQDPIAKAYRVGRSHGRAGNVNLATTATQMLNLADSTERAAAYAYRSGFDDGRRQRKPSVSWLAELDGLFREAGSDAGEGDTRGGTS